MITFENIAENEVAKVVAIINCKEMDCVEKVAV